MTQVETRIGMPLDEFIRAHDKQPFELINGARRRRMPTVFGHSEAIQAIFLALYLYLSTGRAGSVYAPRYG